MCGCVDDGVGWGGACELGSFGGDCLERGEGGRGEREGVGVGGREERD